MYRWWIWLKDRKNKIWVTPALGMLLAMLLALGAAALNRVVPDGTLPEIDSATLEQLLGVISASMLGVATFSLGIMVSAFGSASAGATPRATELVMGDESTRTAIGSFLAAFLYAVVARTALGLGYYGSTGRFVLFVSTLLVLGYLVVTLVVWVRTLSTLGRLNDTLLRIDEAAGQALEHHARTPWLHARPGPVQQPTGERVHSDATGYVTHMDLASLNELAESLDARVHIRVRPGAFVHPGTVLVVCEGAEPDESQVQAVREAIVIDRSRTYDQDPRFGLIVLSEVAQRALSPAVNDPGTAVEVMGVMTRLLITWARLRAETVQAIRREQLERAKDAAEKNGDAEGDAKGDAEAESTDTAAHGPAATPVPDDRPAKPPAADGHECFAEHRLKYPGLTVLPLDAADFLVDSFESIGRDGAGAVEVGIRLQKLLVMVQQHLPADMQPAVLALAHRSLRRGLQALTLDEDRERLRDTHSRLFGAAG